MAKGSPGRPRPAGLILAVLLGILLAAVPARAGTPGVVSGLQGGLVLVQLDSPGRFKPGDQVELSYRAGVLDMSLGHFKVKAVLGLKLTLRAISVSIPPSREMKVMVHHVQPLEIVPAPRGKK